MGRTERRRIGDLGEGIACEYLLRKGFEIVQRNYLKPWGEIDIVARKDGIYRFIEVKSISREKGSREMLNGLTAEDHIHPAKLQRLARAVETYMADIPGDVDFQIDVVAVVLDTSVRRATCKLYEQVL